MKIAYINTEDFVSDFMSSSNEPLKEEHSSLSPILKYISKLSKASRLQNLKYKDLLAVGYSKETGFDFLYRDAFGYLHILCKENRVIVLYLAYASNNSYEVYEVNNKLKNSLYDDLEGISEGYEEEGVVFLAQDFDFYESADVKTKKSIRLQE